MNINSKYFKPCPAGLFFGTMIVYEMSGECLYFPEIKNI